MFRFLFNPLDDNIFASELSYILGEPLKSLGRSQGGMQKSLSRKMIGMWSSFSRRDDPNGEEEDGGALWPQFQQPEWKYLKLEDDELEIGEDIRGRVCMFWER